MKQLTDKDIDEMIGAQWSPNDDKSLKSSVLRELQLSKRIPEQHATPEHITMDFHQHTEEEAWNMLTHAAQSGARTATVITGASGILKIKFQQWMQNSILSPYIVEYKPINNGSFSVKFKNH